MRFLIKKSDKYGGTNSFRYLKTKIHLWAFLRTKARQKGGRVLVLVHLSLWLQRTSLCNLVSDELRVIIFIIRSSRNHHHQLYFLPLGFLNSHVSKKGLFLKFISPLFYFCNTVSSCKELFDSKMWVKVQSLLFRQLL